MTTKRPAATPAQREIIIGGAASALGTATAVITGMLGDLKGTVEDLGLKIDEKTKTLADLNVQYTEKERQLTVQLDLNMKEKGLKAATEILAFNQMTGIPTAELDKLRNDHAALQRDYKAEVEKVTAGIRADEKGKWEQEKKLLEAQHAQSQAENTATINANKTTIAGLEAQVKMLIEQLNEERKAGIERAKAGAIGAINVGDQANRR